MKITFHFSYRVELRKQLQQLLGRPMGYRQHQHRRGTSLSKAWLWLGLVPSRSGIFFCFLNLNLNLRFFDQPFPKTFLIKRRKLKTGAQVDILIDDFKKFNLGSSQNFLDTPLSYIHCILNILNFSYMHRNILTKLGYFRWAGMSFVG